MSEGCAGCKNCKCENNIPEVLAGKQQSVWVDTASAHSYPRLQGEKEVDTVIIGGGITGLTTAYLLQKAGQKVAIVEAAKIGQGVTGYTTAHITEQLDIFFVDLVKRFGEKRSKLVVKSVQEAITTIAGIVQELHLDCDFERVSGYLYTEKEKDVKFLHDEVEMGKKLGVHVEFTQDVPLPFATKGAVKFFDQAQFHPLKYVYGLARHVQEKGGLIFEHTRVTDVKDATVVTESGSISATNVVMATHTPILTRLLPVQGKLSAKRSYVLSGRRSGGQQFPAGLFWDTESPYHYLRSFEDEKGQVLVIGGEDHACGIKEDTSHYPRRLQKYVKNKFPDIAIEHHWSAQVFISADELPYIGRAPFAKHLYVATGFSGTGMTFGTLSAVIMSDLVLGKANQYARLYNPGRLSLSSLGKLAKLGLSNVKHVLVDRFTSVKKGVASDLAAGEGRIMTIEGKKMAVYKDEQGKVTRLSPICTHAGCVVQWNGSEKTWDCPCHGSRFAATGSVIVGPAVKDLPTL